MAMARTTTASAITTTDDLHASETTMEAEPTVSTPAMPRKTQPPRKNKAYACLFCARLFNRSDSLKRHWTTCAVRRRQALDTPQVVPKTRGRKPQACDRCCRLKRACTFTDPCQTCVRSKRTCTYTRVPTAASTSAPTVETIGNVAATKASAMAPTAAPDESMSPASSTSRVSLRNESPAASTNSSSGSATTAVDDTDPAMDATALPLFSANEIDWILDGVDVEGTDIAMESVTTHNTVNGVSNLDLGMNLGLDPAGNDLMDVLGVGMPTDADDTSMTMVPLTGMPASAASIMPAEYLPYDYMPSGQLPQAPQQPQYQQLQHQQHQQHPYQQSSFMQSSALMLRLIRRPTEVDLSALCEFSFLERISRTSGLVDSFHCGSQEQRRTIFQAGQNKMLGMSLGRTAMASASGRSSAWSPLGLTHNVGAVDDADENTQLLAKTHDIVSQIREATLRIQHAKGPRTKKGKDGKEAAPSDVWSPATEALCYDFFRPANIHTCLALFWSFWYPNSPNIHGPSFVPATAPTMLLAAMVLIGACLAPDNHHHANGGRRGQHSVPNLWFGAVEEMVFCEDQDDSDDVATYNGNEDDDASQHGDESARPSKKRNDSCEDCDHEDCEDAAANSKLAWQNGTHKARRRAQLARLQAAFLVCLYQTWEGAPRCRRWARQHRYSAVVAQAREIGLSSATLRQVRTDSSAAFDWDEYILRESLIRTVSYIFDLDAAYALFYRHPPRMVLPELQTDLASPECCFRAATADACFAELVAWRTANAAITGPVGPDPRTSRTAIPISMAAAVQTLCQSTLTPEVEDAFSRLSVLNMFTIVSALYAMTFRVETSLLYTSGPGGEAALIQTALRHWIRLWPSPYRDHELYEMHATGSPPGSTGWPRAVGFIRHAPEYCLVAFFILARIRGGANDDGLGQQQPMTATSSSAARVDSPPPNAHALPPTATVLAPAPAAAVSSGTVSHTVRNNDIKNVSCDGTDMTLLNALVTEFRCRKSSSYCSRMLRQFYPANLEPERSGMAM